MQPVLDAIWEKTESSLQRDDRRHMKEHDKRRRQRKRVIWYILTAVLLLGSVLYICLFMK